MSSWISDCHRDYFGQPVTSVPPRPNRQDCTSRGERPRDLPPNRSRVGKENSTALLTLHRLSLRILRSNRMQLTPIWEVIGVCRQRLNSRNLLITVPLLGIITMVVREWLDVSSRLRPTGTSCSSLLPVDALVARCAGWVRTDTFGPLRGARRTTRGT